MKRHFAMINSHSHHKSMRNFHAFLSLDNSRHTSASALLSHRYYPPPLPPPPSPLLKVNYLPHLKYSPCNISFMSVRFLIWEVMNNSKRLSLCPVCGRKCGPQEPLWEVGGWGGVGRGEKSVSGIILELSSRWDSGGETGENYRHARWQTVCQFQSYPSRSDSAGLWSSFLTHQRVCL